MTDLRRRFSELERTSAQLAEAVNPRMQGVSTRASAGTRSFSPRRRRWRDGTAGFGRCEIPPEHLSARLDPDMFSLAQGHQGLGADGRTADLQLQARFESNVVNFVNFVEAAKHYL
jgi:hypothetical protein